jgi:ABC-type polar amino acid transport system ATPase subunit
MIRISGLRKKYHDQWILNGIDVAVSRGEVAVLLGPSGSGKSTLLRTINGLENFDEGLIQVDDIGLPAGSAQVRAEPLRLIRRRVGMVFQQFNLFPHRTVLDNIIEAPVFVLGQSTESARQTALDLLDRVGLREKANAWPNALSGGQQQRVAIARALAMKPDVLLFDEPTSALDPRMTSEVTRVICDLAAAGQTMVVVTHGMDFARSIAHRVHLLNSGQIVESAPVSEFFEQPRHPVTQAFLQETQRG